MASNNNGPSRLERSLSLTSEPRTLRQYEMAIASMQAMEKQGLAGGINNGTVQIAAAAAATTGGGKKAGKGDREEGAASGGAEAVKLPA